MSVLCLRKIMILQMENDDFYIENDDSAIENDDSSIQNDDSSM